MEIAQKEMADTIEGKRPSVYLCGNTFLIPALAGAYDYEQVQTFQSYSTDMFINAWELGQGGATVASGRGSTGVMTNPAALGLQQAVGSWRQRRNMRNTSCRGLRMGCLARLYGWVWYPCFPQPIKPASLPAAWNLISRAIIPPKPVYLSLELE